MQQDTIPWDVIQIHPIDPFSITSNHVKLIQLSSKTMIDLVTNLSKIEKMKDPNN